jgi:hypothetical protein
VLEKRRSDSANSLDVPSGLHSIFRSLAMTKLKTSFSLLFFLKLDSFPLPLFDAARTCRSVQRIELFDDIPRMAARVDFAFYWKKGV